MQVCWIEKWRVSVYRQIISFDVTEQVSPRRTHETYFLIEWIYSSENLLKLLVLFYFIIMKIYYSNADFLYKFVWFNLKFSSRCHVFIVILRSKTKFALRLSIVRFVVKKTSGKCHTTYVLRRLVSRYTSPTSGVTYSSEMFFFITVMHSALLGVLKTHCAHQGK
jgi:hypothetical protein